MIQTTNQMYIWGGLLNLGVAMGSPMLGNLHISYNLRGGTRKVGKQERNRRKNEGERGGKNT